MKYLVQFSRLFVGILFIFSGLVKANDPLGLSYKMQEFFEVWGWDFLSAYTLSFSIAIIAFEIVAGLAVLVGWQIKLVNWLLLLLIIFFTFLTGYAVLSGKIRECGCFGDCIPLSSNQSFIKDLILLVLILILFFNPKKIKPFFNIKNNILTLVLGAFATCWFMWFTLTNLPVVDCLPYKIGSSLLTNMKIPEGAIPDSTVITFVYNKQGKEIEFTADKFPADFNDSVYQFVKRYDKLVRPGNAMPKIKDFSLTEMESGMDMTLSLLNDSSYKLVFFFRHGYKIPDWDLKTKHLLSLASSSQVQTIVISSLNKTEITEALGSSVERYNLYSCDATAIKTAARSNPTIFLLHKDTIVGKWSYNRLDQVAKQLPVKQN